MSSKEIEMCISSDEIDVSAEEDVFRIILAWIDHDKSKRKKYFAELFRQVRLVYVSRDFLCSDIVTNDLVKDNEGCLDLAEDAMRLIDSKDFGNLSVTPRKSLGTPVILAYSGIAVGCCCGCYFPREDRWCSLGEIEPCRSYPTIRNPVSCRGKLYTLEDELSKLASYNLYSNCWLPLPQKGDREIREIFVSNEDEMYALVTKREVRFDVSGGYLHMVRVSYITKHKPESNSWEDISLFDKLDLIQDSCIVAKDNFIYFIGGVGSGDECKFLTDVHRYNLSRNQWHKVADIQEPKMYPCGAVVNGKIFIAGRITQGNGMSETCQCEVYNETTNEWQFIASFSIIQDACPKLLSVDGTLYAVGIVMRTRGYPSPDPGVQCYDPDNNEWNRKTEIPFRSPSFTHIFSENACSVRIFKEFLNRRLKSFPSEHDDDNDVVRGTQRQTFPVGVGTSFLRYNYAFCAV